MWRRAIYAPGRPFVLGVFRAQADPESGQALFQYRNAKEGAATLYLCRGSTCLPPSNDPSEFEEMTR